MLTPRGWRTASVGKPPKEETAGSKRGVSMGKVGSRDCALIVVVVLIFYRIDQTANA